MKKNNIITCFGIIGLMGIIGLSGCTNDDDVQRNPNLSNPDENITASPIRSTELTYTANLLDANLLDIMDVKVQYIDGDGNIKQEVMTSPTWSKTVSFKRRSAETSKMADITFGMMARTFLKANTQPTKDSYNFFINIDSPMYDTHFDGKSTFTARVHACDSLKIMADKDSSIRTMNYIQDVSNRNDIDSTAISYWCHTQSDTLIVKKRFEWKDSLK